MHSSRGPGVRLPTFGLGVFRFKYALGQFRVRRMGRRLVEIACNGTDRGCTSVCRLRLGRIFDLAVDAYDSSVRAGEKVVIERFFLPPVVMCHGFYS